MKNLRDEDFDIILSKDDYLLGKLNTSQAVEVAEMEKTGRKILWEDKSIVEYPFSDKWIERRINSYRKQDEKAHRNCSLTIQQFRTLLQSGICSYCSHPIIRSNCSLDRKNNSIGHTFENCVLCCIACNVKKKDKEIKVAHWDIETFLDVIEEEVSAFEGESNIISNICDFVGSVAHIPYCASITFRDEKALKAKDYKKLQTIKLYGEDTWTQLEDWFLNESKEIEDKVNSLLESWFKYYSLKHPNLTEKQEKEAKKKKRSQLIENHKLIMYAFNGARYENQFIHKSTRLKFESEIESFGFIEITLKGGCIVFRDSMRMTGQNTLANLCKDYKLPPEFSKTEFPHNFVNRLRLYYKGEVPEAKYWISGQIPEEHRSKEFDLQKVCSEYNVLDTVSDCIILYQLSQSIKNVTGLDTVYFITISALAYNYMMETIHPNLIFLPTSRSVDAFIRQSFQGGRCFPQKGYFKSKFADILHELQNSQTLLRHVYDQCDDFYTVIDAVSLYPSAMWKYDYPIGKPYFEPDTEKVRTALNSCDANFPLGFVECEVQFRDPNIICPCWLIRKVIDLDILWNHFRDFLQKQPLILWKPSNIIK